MSENVNMLIDKMNQESLKKKKLAASTVQGGADGDRPGSQKVKTRQKEIENTDKAIKNLIQEHLRVKKRLEEVQSPDFLLNLKMSIKGSEKEIQEYEKLLKQLHIEQVKREKRMDKIIGKGLDNHSNAAHHDSAQINDTTQRLAYLQEKIVDIKDQIEKADKLRS